MGVVGDFNGDGKLDLIGFDSAAQIAFIQGNGDGTFQAPSAPYVLGYNTEDLAAADLNGDGKLDLVTVQPSNDTYTVLLGNGDGTFNVQAPVPVSGDIGPSTTIADMNADGKLDLVLAPYEFSKSQTVFILPGNGDGTFQTAVQVASNAKYVAAGDFNNDGQMDLAVNGAILLQGPNFVMALASGSSSSQTIKAGQSATFNLSVTPSAGLTGTLNLTCAITPPVTPAPTCSLSPHSFQVSGTSAQAVTVTVGTTAGTAGGAVPIVGFLRIIGPLVWINMPLGTALMWVRNRKRMPRLAVIMLALPFCVSCGGSPSSQGSQGTPQALTRLRLQARPAA